MWSGDVLWAICCYPTDEIWTISIFKDNGQSAHVNDILSPLGMIYRLAWAVVYYLKKGSPEPHGGNIRWHTP